MIPYFLAVLGAVGLLGGASVVLVVKSEVGGALRKFLILAGASAAGFFVCVLLHNLFYALAILIEPIAVLHYLFELLHVAFFLISTIVCPLVFITALIGSIIHLLKQFRG